MPPQRFLALDSLRGICAVLVVIYHFEGDAWIKTVPFVQNAFLFVDFFFVLSGFVIASSYGDRLAAGFPTSRFMFLRLGRLYPLHAAVLAAFITIAAGKHFADPKYNFSDFWTSTLLLQTWMPYTPGETNHWNPPSWSISAEIWIYLLFAFVSRVAKANTVRIMAVLIVAALPILYFGTDRYLNVCFSGGGFVRAVFGFSFGVIAYRMWRVVGGKLSALTLLEFSLTLGCLVLVSVSGARPLSLLCPPLFAVTIIVFACEGGGISRLLLSRPMLVLGLLSYSIYMVHEFVLARFVNLVSELGPYVNMPFSADPQAQFTINSTWLPIGSDIACVIGLACVLFVSKITYNLIESRCREWSRNLVR